MGPFISSEKHWETHGLTFMTGMHWKWLLAVSFVFLELNKNKDFIEKHVFPMVKLWRWWRIRLWREEQPATCFLFVVSTHFKHIYLSKWESFPIFGVKIGNIWVATTQLTGLLCCKSALTNYEHRTYELIWHGFFQCISHRIHGTIVYLHEWLIFMVNVGKYTSPINPMGFKAWTEILATKALAKQTKPTNLASVSRLARFISIFEVSSDKVK